MPAGLRRVSLSMAMSDSSSLSSDTFEATDTPCVGVCSTLYDDVCRGCGRTAAEVANWVFFTDRQKAEVWRRIRAEGYPRRRTPA